MLSVCKALLTSQLLTSLLQSDLSKCKMAAGLIPFLLPRPPRPRPRPEDMLLLPGELGLSTHRCVYSSTQHAHTDVCTHLHNTHTQMCALIYTTLTHRCVHSSTQHSHTDVCTHLHNTHTQMCVLNYTTLTHRYVYSSTRH